MNTLENELGTLDLILYNYALNHKTKKIISLLKMTIKFETCIRA